MIAVVVKAAVAWIAAATAGARAATAESFYTMSLGEIQALEAKERNKGFARRASGRLLLAEQRTKEGEKRAALHRNQLKREAFRAARAARAEQLADSKAMTEQRRAKKLEASFSGKGHSATDWPAVERVRQAMIHRKGPGDRRALRILSSSRSSKKTVAISHQAVKTAKVSWRGQEEWAVHNGEEEN